VNKFKILAIVVLICILGQGAALLYFVNKTQALAGKVGRYGPKYAKLAEQFQEMSGKYDAAAKELGTVKTDRENILAQIKSLLVDRAKVAELERVVQEMKAEASSGAKQLESTEKQLGEAKDQGLSLRREIDRLNATQNQLTKERDALKIAYAKVAQSSLIEELRDKNSALQRDLKSETARAREQEKQLEAQLKLVGQENARLTQEKNKWITDRERLTDQKGETAQVRDQEKQLEAQLKLVGQENARLTQEKNRWIADRDKLTGQLSDYKKNYAEAVKKNKAMASKISQTPSKFVELSRQNRVLLRQTAEMHYNLGVFYTRNKEYDRAVAEFEKCIEIDPNDAAAHFNLGYIYSEYLVNRDKAMDHFRHYLRLAKSDDPDVDWVKRYLLTWESYSGKMPMQ
jgi:chromosome segregation ATPase